MDDFLGLSAANFNGAMLGPGEEFIIIVNGREEDLPDDLLRAGNFIMMDLPQLCDGSTEVLVVADTALGEVHVGNFALLGGRPIVLEPATLALVGLGAAALVARRRRRNA